MKRVVLMLAAPSLVLWLGATAAHAADAKRVAELRARVERLADELRNARDDNRAEQRALRAQSAELRLQLRLERVRQETLLRARNNQRSRAGEMAERTGRLREPVATALRTVSAYVSRSLPLRVAERAGALTRLERQLESGSDPVEVLSRLWQFLEDELTMTGELGVHQQVIQLNGSPRLVDVLHVGLALLYYRTAEGEAGWYRAGEFEPASTPQLAIAIDGLMEHVRQNRRSGVMELPVPPLSLNAVGKQ